MSIANLLVPNDNELYGKTMTLSSDLTVNGLITGTGTNVVIPFSWLLGGGLINTNLTGNFVKNVLDGITTITMYIDAKSASNAANATIYTGTASVPTSCRPAIDVFLPYMVLDNSAVVNGAIEIRSDGTVIIGTLDLGKFTASGNSGYSKGSITYCL